MNWTTRLSLVLLGLIAVLTLRATPRVNLSPGAATAPSAPSRVLIVSIDGCRPDMLLRAKAPTIAELTRQGSFTFWARTTALSVTLPSHTSMMTGVTPRKHEIEWNVDLPLATPVYPKYPPLFEVAHRRGYSTAMAAGKSKFAALAKPGTVDFLSVPTAEKIDDVDVTTRAVSIIQSHRPDVMLVHLPGTDNAGHASGWGSDEQLAAIETADRQVARLLNALATAGVRDQTLLIVTADHGGAGRTHLPDDPRARHIPWIAVGPGVRRGLDLTNYADLTVNIEDTFATACFALKLPLDPRLDGKPVREIFGEQRELLSNTK